MRGVKLAAHKPVVHSTTFYSKRWNGYNWCHHPTLPSPPPPPPPSPSPPPLSPPPPSPPPSPPPPSPPPPYASTVVDEEGEPGKAQSGLFTTRVFAVATNHVDVVDGFKVRGRKDHQIDDGSELNTRLCVATGETWQRRLKSLPSVCGRRQGTTGSAASFGCCCGGWFHHTCMWTWYQERTSPKQFGELGRLARSFPG